MVHLIYANIDWKASRHDTVKAEIRNLRLLEATVRSIVSNMHPAVLCFCEVGTATTPLTEQNMVCLTQSVAAAWKDAATKHVEPEIRFHYVTEKPYLTAWDAKQCDCRHFRIMWNVFQHKEPRTAQLFLCCLRDAEDSNGINVINVHAPSGKQPLTDKQRTQMLKNLLQSNSKAMQHSNIGEHRGIIGGDMNTTPHAFDTIANKLKRETVSLSPFRYQYPSWAKRGDACIDIGHIGTPLQLRAKNHDPKHEVYGVSLQFSQASGDAKRSQDLPAQPEKDTQLAHATKQRCLADADAAVVASGSQDPPAQREHGTKQQELAYLIFNAFTHELALDDTCAEAIIKAALVDEPRWPPETLQQIDDVFRFFS